MTWRQSSLTYRKLRLFKKNISKKNLLCKIKNYKQKQNEAITEGHQNWPTIIIFFSLFCQFCIIIVIIYRNDSYRYVFLFIYIFLNFQSKNNSFAKQNFFICKQRNAFMWNWKIAALIIRSIHLPLIVINLFAKLSVTIFIII